MPLALYLRLRPGRMSSLRVHVSDIVELCANSEMINVQAAPNVTPMQYNFAGRNFPISFPPDQPMSALYPTIPLDVSVAVRIYCAEPQQTSRIRLWDRLPL
jgi:hypothetical protein